MCGPPSHGNGISDALLGTRKGSDAATRLAGSCPIAAPRIVLDRHGLAHAIRTRVRRAGVAGLYVILYSLADSARRFCVWGVQAQRKNKAPTPARGEGLCILGRSWCSSEGLNPFQASRGPLAAIRPSLVNKYVRGVKNCVETPERTALTLTMREQEV